jgi:transposase
VDRDVDPQALVGFLMFWAADDAGSERRAGVAGDGPYDMRKGFPSLALQVQEVLKRDPLSGHLFCFRGRRGDLLKVIWHDGQGACLFTKQLERGRFLWPLIGDGVVTISAAQFAYLLSGIDCWRPTSVG